jgi:hypothetical protein
MAATGNCSFAQKTTKTTAAKSGENKIIAAHSKAAATGIKDTLAYNVKTTFAKLCALATNDNIPAEAFFSSYLGNDASGRPAYASSIIAPNSIENKVQQLQVDWENAVTHWVWRSTLLRYPQYQEPEQTFISLQNRIAKIIYGLPKTDASDPKNKVLSFSADQNITDVIIRKANPNEYDELILQFEFVKPLRQTQQQCIDSLASLYRPGFNNLETAADAWKKFDTALRAAGFSKPTIEDALATELQRAANRDIKTAYLMHMATDIRYDGVLAKLNAAQLDKIIKMGQASLDARFNGQKFDIRTFDPNPPTQTYSPYSGNSSNTISTNPLFNTAAPQGEKTRCAVCEGTGQMDQVAYSHTYNGISGNYTTTVTKKVTCTFCNGTGWVMKYKKH